LKKVFNITIDSEELKKFKKFCIDKDISVSEAIRQLMEMARLTNSIKYIEDGKIE